MACLISMFSPFSLSFWIRDEIQNLFLLFKRGDREKIRNKERKRRVEKPEHNFGHDLFFYAQYFTKV
jgi:hypothetical protein